MMPDTDERLSIQYHAEDVKTRRFWVWDNEWGQMITKFATPEDARNYVTVCKEIHERVRQFSELEE